MWRYNNVCFIYNNPVDSIHGNKQNIPYLMTYVKSKYALLEALRIHVEESYLGAYTEIDQRSITYDPPIKVSDWPPVSQHCGCGSYQQYNDGWLNRNI